MVARVVVAVVLGKNIKMFRMIKRMKSRSQKGSLCMKKRERKVEFTTAYGGALVPFIVLAQILFQGPQIGSNYWMAMATPVSDDAKLPVGGSKLIIVYVAFSIGSSFCILCRDTLLVTAGFRTANTLFNKMHMSIFRAPMSSFDATPSGRILNRVS